jgi:hypothetical protein
MPYSVEAFLFLSGVIHLRLTTTSNQQDYSIMARLEDADNQVMMYDPKRPSTKKSR